MKYFLGLLLSVCLIQAFGQAQNNPMYDVEKKVHFGFAIGTNVSGLKMYFSDEFYEQGDVSKVNVSSFPFLSIQPVCNIHLKPRWDLRFVVNFSLTQRNIDFTHRDGHMVSHQVSSAYFGVPMLLKHKSERHNNWRFYTIAGLEYAHDFDSNQGGSQDFRSPQVAFVRHNFYYSYGAGFDLYYKLFKLSPELRVANGLHNVLAENPDSYTALFSGIRNRMIWLSFFFE